MKLIRIAMLFVFLVSTALFFQTYLESESINSSLKQIENLEKTHIRSSFSSKNSEDVPARFEYEMNRLKDPLSQQIPRNIRSKELAFAEKLPKIEEVNKTRVNKTALENWSRRGPFNVGGRTRALAIDLDFNGSSNKKILAGGVSGGMFISEDDGLTWIRTTSNSSLPSVTCLAQDPTSKNIWYYGTGEAIGNSASHPDYYLGEGIFKSTDGGKNWNQLPSTFHESKLNVFDNVFDAVYNLAVHPQTGAIYAATLGTIQISNDGGSSWDPVLVGKDASNNLSYSTDVVIGSDGVVYATLSRDGYAINQGEFGIFKSTNGTQFSNISPPDLSSDPSRIVLGEARSDPNTLYVLVQANQSGSTAQDHQLFRYNTGSNSWTNLSANLPNEQGADNNASFSTQSGYDMIVKVKPDNPNVVWIGGVNLYRSTDGGQNFTRVGGYKTGADYSLYENSHSDFHSMSFYPNNPNAMINGHDGGLSKTTNVLEQPQTWTLLNKSYVTSQFYALAIDPQVGNDNLIIGGMQDNGTWGTESTTYEDDWFDLLSGDGGYAAIDAGASNLYVSAQNGYIIRYTFQNSQWFQSIVSPDAQGYQFIAPYVLDPNNSNVMYLAAGNTVWRNSDLGGIPQGNSNLTQTNWSQLSNSAVANTAVTTLSVSKQPVNRLYFGATDNQSNSYIIRVDDVQNNHAGTNITPPGIIGGSFPSCIAINPTNADEIMAVFSNYNVPSIWYSSNGGSNWTNVEGNLSGENGPSVRWAIIAPGAGYYLATSTGVYSAESLNGASTVWALEGSDIIGNVVVNMMALREGDGFMVAATHGRGVYSTKISSSSSAPKATTDKQSLSLQVKPGEINSTSFNLGNDGGSTMSFNISVTGDLLLGKSSETSYKLSKPIKEKKLRSELLRENNLTNNRLSSVENIDNSILSKGNQVLGQDIYYLDDGDGTADDFLGWGDGSDMYWYNEFNVSGFNFQVDEIQFFMRTENVFSNPLYIGVFDSEFNVLVDGNLEFQTSVDGMWYSVSFDPINFVDGDTFYIEIETVGSGIFYPAGIDTDANIPNKSFYYDGANWVSVATISGYENAAFLIRATGTVVTAANENPVAIAQVNPTQANIGDLVTFDAGNSYDNDGQIAQTLWDFGDGNTSTQVTAQHSYSQANTYTYTLTVTDDKGATGQTTGQVTISEVSSSYVTVNPKSGSVSPGSSQLITLTLDATTLTEGTYVGQVNIITNGGNLLIPIDYLVKVENKQELPMEYSLEQNYPNPFNPTTKINYSVPKQSNVTLRVFDVLGREVAILVNKEQTIGNYEVEFNASNLTSGIYFYRIQAGQFDDTKKMLLLK